MVEWEIILVMEREEESAINKEDMVAVAEKLDKTMNKEIVASNSAEKRKQLRSKRK